MPSSVFALGAVDVNRHFLKQVERNSVGRFELLQIGGEDVFAFAGGNALGELAPMVGIDFPSNFLGFIGGAANSHRDSINRPIIGTPDCPKDKGVRLV